MNLVEELLQAGGPLCGGYYEPKNEQEAYDGALMLRAREELIRLERQEAACKEWLEKSEWMLNYPNLFSKHLGRHKMDALRFAIEDLVNKNNILQTALVDVSSTLAHIQEYWNKDKNEQAMADALETIESESFDAMVRINQALLGMKK